MCVSVSNKKSKQNKSTGCSGRSKREICSMDSLIKKPHQSRCLVKRMTLPRPGTWKGKLKSRKQRGTLTQPYKNRGESIKTSKNENCWLFLQTLCLFNNFHPSIHFLYPLNPLVRSRGGGSLSQQSSGERRGTPWTGRQSITGPHRDKRDKQPHTRSLSP